MTNNDTKTTATSTLRQKIRLGDLLVEKKIITVAQLEHALQAQKKSGARLGNALISLGYIDEQGLMGFLRTGAER